MIFYNICVYPPHSTPRLHHAASPPWKDTCILDEADKLCADDAGNTLYLAQDIAGLEHAEGILVNAFAAGQCVSNEESLREVETELKKCFLAGFNWFLTT